MPISQPYKLGRLPRTFNPSVPHLSALVATSQLAAPPPAVDYTRGMPEAPNKFGPMLNDVLGDCTCAAYYHARQIWTYHATGKTATAPTAAVKLLYEKACGYHPRVRGEGPGGAEQHVLAYIHKNGAPLSAGGTKGQKILGFVEVDHRNVDDVKRTIYNGGVAYIGLRLPAHIIPKTGKPPLIWDIKPGEKKSAGGHCIILAGYNRTGLIGISWGFRYTLTWRFFARYADEVYAIADSGWAASKLAKRKGLTLPGGVTRQQLKQQMQFI